MSVRKCNWRTRSKKIRVIRLYQAYQNMLARVKGRHKDGNGVARWKGLENGFRNWTHFRQWAVAAGYNRKGLTLDRRDETKGYTPENSQWITRQANAFKAALVHKSECVCFACKSRRNEEAFLCPHGKFEEDCMECNGA